MSEAMVRRGGGGKKEGRYGWKKNSIFVSEPQQVAVRGMVDAIQHTRTLKYSDGYVLHANGSLTLAEPISTFTITRNTPYGDTTLRNKYYGGISNSSSLGYSSSAFSLNDYGYPALCTGTIHVMTGNFVAFVLDDDAGAYPATGIQDGYSYTEIKT